MMWFLIIFGILILLAVLLSRLRLGVRLAWEPGSLRVEATVGPAHIRLYPPAPRKKKSSKPEPAAKEAPQQPQKKRSSFPKPTADDLQLALKTLLPPLRKALDRTRRGIRITPLEISVTVGGGEDPAAAAQLYGQLHAVVWTVMPALEQLVRIPDPAIHVGIDFDADTTVSSGKVGIFLTLGTLISVALGIGIPVIKFLAGYMKRGQNANPETKQTASAA